MMIGLVAVILGTILGVCGLFGGRMSGLPCRRRQAALCRLGGASLFVLGFLLVCNPQPWAVPLLVVITVGIGVLLLLIRLLDI